MAVFFASDFVRSASVRVALVTLEYSITMVDALHTIVTKVSHEGGKLLIESMAFSSPSIVVP